MKTKLPVTCPGCTNQLRVQKLNCNECGTSIDGKFELPLFAYLSPEEQEFTLAFVKSSGSLKEMSKQLNLSYPTVRNMLDDLIKRINIIETKLNKI
jgi:hypothetical protein